MDNYERQLFDSAMELLHRLAGYADAKADFKPILHFADKDEKVITFPKKETLPPDGKTPSCEPAQEQRKDNARHEKMG